MHLIQRGHATRVSASATVARAQAVAGSTGDVATPRRQHASYADATPRGTSPSRAADSTPPRAVLANGSRPLLEAEEAKLRAVLLVDEAVTRNALIIAHRDATARWTRDDAHAASRLAAARRVASPRRATPASPQRSEWVGTGDTPRSTQRALPFDADSTPLPQSPTRHRAQLAEQQQRDEEQVVLVHERVPHAGWSAYKRKLIGEGTYTPTRHGPAGASVVINEVRHRKTTATKAVDHAAGDVPPPRITGTDWVVAGIDDGLSLEVLARPFGMAEGAKDDNADDGEFRVLAVAASLMLQRRFCFEMELDRSHAVLLLNTARALSAAYAHECAIRDEAVRRLLLENQALAENREGAATMATTILKRKLAEKTKHAAALEERVKALQLELEASKDDAATLRDRLTNADVQLNDALDRIRALQADARARSEEASAQQLETKRAHEEAKKLTEKLRAVEAALTRSCADRDHLQRELDAQRRAAGRSDAERSSEAQRHADAVAMLKKNHDHALAQERATAIRDLEAAKAEHDREMAAMRDRYEQRIAELTREAANLRRERDTLAERVQGLEDRLKSADTAQRADRSDADRDRADAAAALREAKVHAAALLDAARSDAEQIRRTAAADADGMRSAARSDAEKITREAREAAARLRKQAEDDAAAAEQRANAARNAEAAARDAQRAAGDAAALRRSAQEEADALRRKAQADADALFRKAQQDAEAMRRRVQEEADAARKKAQDGDAAKRKAQDDADAIRRKAQQDADAARKKADEDAAERIRAARAEADALLAKARDDADTLRLEAEEEADAIRAAAEAEAAKHQTPEQQNAALDDAVEKLANANEELRKATRRDKEAKFALREAHEAFVELKLALKDAAEKEAGGTAATHTKRSIAAHVETLQAWAIRHAKYF